MALSQVYVNGNELFLIVFIIFCVKLEHIFTNNCVKIVLSLPACLHFAYLLCYGYSKLEVTIQFMSVRFNVLCVVTYSCSILGCNGM